MKKMLLLTSALMLAVCLGARAHEGHAHDEAKEAAAGSYTGEVLDLACYLGHGTAGKDHQKCSKTCLTKDHVAAGLLLHPAWVHFPIALLVAGAAAESASRLRPQSREPLSAVASWALWLGALAALLAAGFGYLAESTAPHVPDAWRVMDRHEDLGYWTAGVFAALALWRRFGARRFPRLFFAAWLAALVLLLATAQQGGELVFTYGMGVVAP